jgi:hypothetical protein
MAEPLTQHKETKKSVKLKYTNLHMHFLLYQLTLSSLKNIKISVQEVNTLKIATKSVKMLHRAHYASHQHSSLVRFILHRLRATVSAQLLMRIGSTL